jgi:hypothetical protein
MWRRKPQRPPPTYEDVRLVAEALSHINANLIQRHFAVSAGTAQQFMERLVAEKRFGDLQPDGWHYPPIRKLRRHRPRRKPMAANRPKTEESIADMAARIAELEQEGHALRARIKRLQTAGKTVIAQREEWKSRSRAAEDEVKRLAAELSSRPTVKPDNRFDMLRRIIARELHPDFCTGGHLEKLMRQECFKKLWPQIEELAERR